MGDIFVKNLYIENYKCFKNQDIALGLPDGNTPGSGLNILIGENGNGKTAVLEALNYLTQNTFSSTNKLQINDFCDVKKPIIFRGDTEAFRCKSGIEYYKDWIINANGLEFEAKSRDRKSSGKLLSPPFSIKNNFRIVGPYQKPKGGKVQEVDARDKSFSNDSIIDNEINIFYFDKNRNRHLSAGNYRTTFESICDDLNWRFLKNLDTTATKDLAKNVSGEYFSKVLELSYKGVGTQVAKNLAEFLEDKFYEDIRIELIDLLHPFSNAFFAHRADDDLTQIKTKDLGSGIEILLTLLLLKSISDQSKGSIIYLIDEPELHLHPKAQAKLSSILLEESRTKQIMVSTHSPYLFKNCVQQATRLLVFRRNKKGMIEISDENKLIKPLFLWSPSWGEINYKAYDLPSVEFHNELYGYAQETKNAILEGLNKTKVWKNALNGKDEKVSLPKYVRNAIHHPENRSNQLYTEAEMRESIETLIGILKP